MDMLFFVRGVRHRLGRGNRSGEPYGWGLRASRETYDNPGQSKHGGPKQQKEGHLLSLMLPFLRDGAASHDIHCWSGTQIVVVTAGAITLPQRPPDAPLPGGRRQK